MKKLKFFSLWVILVTLAFVSVNCGKDPGPDPIDPIDTTHIGTKSDTVIIEVTIIVPEPVTIVDATVSVIGSCFPEGLLYQYSAENKRIFTFKSVDPKVVGAEVFCNIILMGNCNGYPVAFDRVTDQSKTYKLVKGMNKLKYEFTYH
ncbi:MAG: hypothetical protein WCN88_04070 [Candidatus Falkowbacteria bacterium]